MAYVTPQTYVYLYNNISLPSNYEHTFYFNNITEQNTYFTTTKPPVKTYAPTTYQNITAGVIRVGEKIKDIYDINYMKFTNGATNYENKTYYCFVTNVVYINENTTEIHYTVDVMQTYLFQYSSNGNLKKKMFIDRTHILQEDDRLGANCMFNDEGLDLGIDMYTSILNTSIPNFDTVSYGVEAYVLYTGKLTRYPQLDSDTSIPNDLTPTEVQALSPSRKLIVVKTPGGKVYGYKNTINDGIYQNLYNLDHNLLFPLSGEYFTIYNNDGTPYLGGEDTTSSRVGDGALGLSYFVQIFNALGKSDAIVRIILLPTDVIERKKPNTNTNMLYNNDMTPITTTIKGGTTFGGYTPKNKKLYVYPYNYIVIDNNENDSKVYKPQNMTDDILETGLKICYQASFLNGELVAYPVNYVGGDVSNGIIKNIGVETAYITSAYKDWLANSEIARNMAIRQHKINSMINIVGGSFGKDGSGIETGEYQPTLTGERGDWLASSNGKLLKGTGSFALNATKSTVKAMVNSYNFISNLTQQKAQMAEIPNSVKGSLDSNMSFITNRMGFKAMRVRVQAGVAKRIDNYFSVFGYKISDWQIPKLKVRSNWTFIKTAGCAVVGDIPKDFESAIDQIFDNGITFWANTSNFMNYGDFSNPDPS